MTKLIIAVVLAAFATGATAQDCGRIANDAQRLACFDKAESPHVGTGRRIWVDHAVDPITDGVTTRVHLQNFDPNNPGFGGREHRIELLCAPDLTQIVSFFFRRSMWAEGGYDVTIRYDALEPFVERFPVAPNRSISERKGEEAAEFVNTLRQHDRLAVRFPGEYEEPSTAVFDLTNLQQAITESAMPCDFR